MKFTTIPTLKSDLQQLREVPPLRLRLFGRSFGPSLKASELRLRASDDGRLRAQVRFGFFWLKMPESLLEPIVARHFALDTKRALLASMENPHVAVPPRPVLQRANAMRRVPSPAAAEATPSPAQLRAFDAERKVRFVEITPSPLTRHNSFSAVVESADEDSAHSASSWSSGSSTTSSQQSTPASSLVASPVLAANTSVDLDAYCDVMAQDVGPGRRSATYGTEVEVRALADITGRPIYVLSEVLTPNANGKGTTVSYDKHQIYFPSEGLDVAAAPIALLLGGGGTGKDTQRNHYEPLTGANVSALWTPELLTGLYGLEEGANAVLEAFWTPKVVLDARGQALDNGNCLFDAVGQQLAEARGTPAAVGARVPRTDIPEAHAMASNLRQQTVAFLRANAKTTVMSLHTLRLLSDSLEPLQESLKV